VPYPYPLPIITPLTRPDRGGPVTVYFRTRFQFNEATTGVTLYSESLVDDGAVFYLNGMEALLHLLLGRLLRRLLGRVLGEGGGGRPYGDAKGQGETLHDVLLR
jgi:hypothetical protein